MQQLLSSSGHETAVSSDVGKQYASTLEKEPTKGPNQVKKKMMKTSPQALLKLSKSWWNKTAERLCWVCIGVQSQWMCSIMLILGIVIQSLLY